ncbi:MAG: hypothetical protein AAF557_13545 [Pseudomonadota bacterium]
MSSETVTFVNPLGEALAPLLLAIRSTGFFEVFVYFPAMVIVAAVLFIKLKRTANANGTFQTPFHRRTRYLLLALYALMCFFATGAFAVALKTLMLEETDYTEAHWFIPYVSYLHFYITSVAGVFVYLVWTNRPSWFNRALCIYVQIGFLGAYWIGGYRIMNEEWDLLDPASGLSGFYLFLVFGVLNVDIALRFGHPTKQAQCESTPLLLEDLRVRS